jgi:CheY-like chemotaxis protein
MEETGDAARPPARPEPVPAKAPAEAEAEAAPSPATAGAPAPSAPATPSALATPSAPAVPAAETVPEASAQPAAASPGGLRVLVVDDNGDSAESLAMLLSLCGHETHVARSGPEALTSADALRPDAILLDLGLPGLNGYEVCRRVRAAGWARAIPIIAITGWGQAEDRQRSTEAGFDAHLVKPVLLADVTALLERSLR